MAIKFLQTPDESDDSIRFQMIERLKVYFFGGIVLFASFGMGKRPTGFYFWNLTVRRIAFRSKLCSALFLPGWLLSLSEMLTETVRRGVHDFTSFGLAIIKSAAPWKELHHRLTRRKTSSRSESFAKKWIGLSGR